jgi:diphosphomevalonate decarboxylase
MKTCRQIVDTYLAGCQWAMHDVATVYAPANIALCKYWGKRERGLNLPVTDSLSISLGTLGSHCTMRLAEQDAYFLNGAPVAQDSPFAVRLRTFLDLFRGDAGCHYHVEAVNTVATAAGFASSASGFAAVVMALHQLHGWQLDERILSVFARMGSGSACRSLWKGFVHWHAGTRADGMDSFAEPLRSDWDELRVGLLSVETGTKAISSREAMNRTVATSALYACWPEQVKQDLATLQQAIAACDFVALGACAEQNAMAMHATMIAAKPPVLYWHPQSVAAMQAVWRARNDGLSVYFTMDAGPNVKILFEEARTSDVLALFPDLLVADPWAS